MGIKMYIYIHTYIHINRKKQGATVGWYIQRPHRSSPLANNVENIDRKQVWASPSISPKSASCSGGAIFSLGNTSPRAKRHLNRFSSLLQLMAVTNRQTDAHTEEATTVTRTHYTDKKEKLIIRWL